MISAATMPAAARKWLQGVLLATAGVAGAFGAHHAGLLDRFEGIAWDARARLGAGLSAPPAEPRIVLVLVDQKSLDWGETQLQLSWPWPREAWAEIVDYCTRGGARSIALDILFTEPSSRDKSVDEHLARTLEHTGRTALAVAASRGESGAAGWPSSLPAPRAADAVPTGIRLPVRERLELPISDLLSGASLLGNVATEPDADGVHRRIPPVIEVDGRLVPFLGLASHLAAPDVPDADYRIAGSTLRGAFPAPIPLDRHGRAILRYPDPDRRFVKLSAAAVLQSALGQQSDAGDRSVPLETFQNAYVLVGYSARGLLDIGSTPLDNAVPGVEIHASFLDNGLRGRFMQPVGPGLALIVTWLLAAIAASAIRFEPRATRDAGALVGFGLIPGGVSVGLYLGGWAWPWVWPTLATLLAAGCATIWNYATEGHQRRFLKSAFRHYLSPSVIERLLEDPSNLALGGERRTVTLLFSDLEGFSSIAEDMDPAELTDLLNAYLSAMTDVVLDEQGTLDKYEGDAILAFWNAPVDQDDHAARACRAAARCQQVLAERNPDWRRRAGRPLKMRIGVHTGEVAVGNMGSERRFDYTVLGDAANLASRLEGANKLLGTNVMISDRTRAAAGDAVRTRRLGRLQVVGRDAPVTVHEILGPVGTAPPPWIDAWNEGLERVEQGQWAEAARSFERCEGDAAARVYAERCRSLAGAPPDRWDGVWRLESK